jgi:hypothetical protein
MARLLNNPPLYFYVFSKQEYEKYEDRKLAILNRVGGNAMAEAVPADKRSTSLPLLPSSSDPLAERLKKIEEEAAASKKLAQISVGLAVAVAFAMTVTKSK